MEEERRLVAARPTCEGFPFGENHDCKIIVKIKHLYLPLLRSLYAILVISSSNLLQGKSSKPMLLSR